MLVHGARNERGAFGLWRELIGAEINFDLEVTETGEIDLLVDGPTDQERVDRSDLLPPVQSEAVSRLGDLWHVGEHRLLCGDACDPASYADLMDGELARMVFTDPPYNVPIEASGEMTSAEFEHFLKTVFANLAAASIDGAMNFICMDWRHLGEVTNAASTWAPSVCRPYLSPSGCQGLYQELWL